jgi:hypothetical protein
MTTKTQYPIEAITLTPGLQMVASRYFSDLEFQGNLHINLVEALAKAGISLSEREVKIIADCLPLFSLDYSFVIYNQCNGGGGCWVER